MNAKIQQLLVSIQQSPHLTEEEKNALLQSANEIDKEIEIVNFKLDRTEKVKRTTAILLEETIEELEQKRKAVEAQNRELEIESSLERVRTQAMSMSKAGNLMDVCQVVYTELQLLGFDELRNAMINIYEDDKTYFLNYDYAPGPGKTVTRMPYDFHPLVSKQVRETKNAADAFNEFSFSGQELKDFRELRKNNGEPDDPKLEDSSSLHYYFYSIGAGSIGISTYSPITANKLGLLKRFRNVFNLAYQRYIDITKAEAQAREAEIELALERVRSRSMAMHKSEELAGLSLELVKQVQALGVSTWFCAFNIYDDDPQGSLEWGSNGEGTFPKYRTPKEGIFLRYYEAGQRGEKLLINEIGKQECPAHYEYLCSLPGVGEQLLKMKDAGIPFPASQIDHVAFFSYGYILFITYKPVPDAHDIFKRFAKVFEQTYTRFLDLKKAEVQARESLIQLALERVRARTMAMQKSSELGEAAALLFQQVKSLGIDTYSSGFTVWQNNDTELVSWMCNADGSINPPFIMPADDIEWHRKQYQSWKHKEACIIHDFSGTAMQAHYAYLRSFPLLDEAFKKSEAAGVDTPARQVHNVFNFSQGNMLFITLQPAQEVFEIFARFAKVFEQTYTRFLDLQKAESQAREAQIEIALERVRSRAMAMHSSEELKALIGTVFIELTKLDLALTRCIIWVFEQHSNAARWWMANGEDPLNPMSFFLKYHEHPAYLRFLAEWKNQNVKFVYDLKGQDKINWDDILFNETELKNLPAVVKDGMRSPERVLLSASFNNFGGINVASLEPLSGEHFDILLRFAKVFDLTYTRFLDLQKAEAQAREAQIEAALERVRSRSMAMHKSEELKDVIRMVLEQFIHLNIRAEHAGFYIDYKVHDDMHIWLADPNLEPFYAVIPYFDTPTWNSFLEAKAKGTALHTDLLDFETKNKFYKSLFKLFAVPEEAKQFYMQCKGLAVSTVLLDNVGLYIENFSAIPYTGEENKILMRFGKVFQQTYTRFLDLQKAEAQAKEAQIEAALEKVRSRTMAMQSSNELQETAAVLFQEFKKLGTDNAYQVTIGIYNEAEGLVDFRVTNWAGSGEQENRSFLLDMAEPTVVKPSVAAWKAGKKSLVIDLTGEALEEWINYRNKMSGVTISSKDTEGRRVINIAYFSKGHISISTPVPAPQETIKTLERFAAVFDGTYTRFLDLEKAEAQAREAQVEAALERVRSRTLAMQKSDELADTAAELFKQLIGLGIEPNRLYIGIVNGDTKDMEMWATDEDGSGVGKKFTFNAADNTSVKKLYDGWKNKIKSVTVDMQGEELDNYISYLKQLHIPLSHALTQKRRVQSVAYFDKGFIGMASPDEQSEKSIQLLERFAAVFNLTFTRFNDLKIAEAHAEQAEQDLIAIKEAKQKAEEALTELQATQKQLVQSEKMASLGELTAGIAHEIQNPLNFVNNFSEVSVELIKEMVDEVDKGNTEEVKAIAGDLVQNLEKINHHGKRADAIVKGMLQHSRSSSGQKEMTGINALCDEYLRLAYHGLRAKDKSFNAKFETSFDDTIGKVNIMPQEIGRVVLNLINNAFYAVSERKKLNTPGYESAVTVSTVKKGNHIEIKVSDNGTGIPQQVLDKIFQPFFTTKPTGQGTGLGLSLSYDIIKAHGGELSVETKEGEGTAFIIQLPAKEN